jgi:hypothetical protein
VVAATVAQNTTSVADVVSLALGPGPAIPKGLRALHVGLAGRAPIIGSASPDPGPDSWIEWCDAAEDLLRWLV